MNMTRSSQKHPLAGFNNDGCGSVEKSNSASGFGKRQRVRQHAHDDQREPYDGEKDRDDLRQQAYKPAPHHGFEEPWAPVRDRFRRAGLPSFVEVESACIVDGLFHSLALLY